MRPEIGDHGAFQEQLRQQLVDAAERRQWLGSQAIQPYLTFDNIQNRGTMTTTRSEGAWLITAERHRQVENEGYTPEHDAQHADELVPASIAYLFASRTTKDDPLPARWWPWDEASFKPTGRDNIDHGVRDLVKAGALIAAEIDRRLALTLAQVES